RHTRFSRDWSSDVCSSDLTPRKPMKVSREEIVAQSKVRPDLVEQMFDDDGIEVWRPGEINDAGRPILYSWRNGERQAWEVVDERSEERRVGKERGCGWARR